MTTTPRPWKIVEHFAHNDRAGYIAIEGPNGEHIADIFPFGAQRKITLETARDNARWIVGLVNGDEAT